MVTSNNMTSSDVTSLLLQVTSTWPMPLFREVTITSASHEHMADANIHFVNISYGVSYLSVSFEAFFSFFVQQPLKCVNHCKIKMFLFFEEEAILKALQWVINPCSV